MTPLLLDTHAFLWFVFGDSRLSGPAAEAIADSKRRLILSIASLWEITIKQQIGKLELGMALDGFLHDYVEGRQIEVLPIQLAHLAAYDRLPLAHRDPFDRLLMAQAKALGVPIVTADPNFRHYEIELVW